MVATLRLTDGSNYVDLLQTGSGAILTNWLPARSVPRGTWRESPFPDGRRLAHYKHDNVTETFNIYTQDFTQDNAIRALQTADRLLHKAMNYWTTDWQNEPVWLEAKATRESNVRYAAVYAYAIPNDANPYGPDFTDCADRPTLDDMTVVIERGHWQSTPPGTGECVEVFAQDAYDGADITRYYEPLANEDNVVATENPPLFTGIDYVFPLTLEGDYPASPYLGAIGIRFPNVRIPYGTTVAAAFVRVRAALNDAGGQTADVRAHKVVDSWDFQPEINKHATDPAAAVAMFKNRTRTTSSVAWAPIAWVAGNTYDTADISAVIQEIVDQPGWVSGNSITIFLEGNVAGQPAKFVEIQNGGSYPPQLHLTVSGGYTYGKAPDSQCRSDVTAGIWEPAESADDATAIWATTSMNLNGTSLAIGFDAVSGRECGVRFRGVTIPKDAVILSAYVEFQCSVASAAACACTIYGENYGYPQLFSTFVDFLGRTRTASSVAWTIPAWVLGNQYNTPDITNIVQEIVNRIDWASGQNMTMLFTTPVAALGVLRQAEAWDSAVFNPKLHVSYVVYSDCGSCVVPRSVFFSNKHVDANLTHIYYYDASAVAWSGNLLGAITPFAFLPPVPIQTGDFVIFGIETATGAGPYTNPIFDNLVFDIVEPVVIAGNATLTWTYSNGGPGWTVLPVRDNTGSIVAGNLSFTVPGVHSIHFDGPANWLEQAGGPGPTTALWVKCTATVPVPPGDSIAPPPEQGNRDIYSIQWPYAQFSEEDVLGDIPALARFILENMSDRFVAAPLLPTSRFMCGLRTLSRGEDFTAYLNISNEQNPAWLTVTDTGPGAFATTSYGPSGRALRWNSVAGVPVPLGTMCTLVIDATASAQYYGEYRAFLRVRAEDLIVHTLQLGVRISYTSTEVLGPLVTAPAMIGRWGVDMGTVRIPGAVTYRDDEPVAEITFQVYASTAADSDMYFMDLVLIPTDEWSGDFEDMSASLLGQISVNQQLFIDSVLYPKRQIRSLLYHRAFDYYQASWRPVANGEAILHPNTDQRLWFLALRWSATTLRNDLAEPGISHSIDVEGAFRYMSGRGDR